MTPGTKGEAVAQIVAEETARSTRRAVAGFDFTFSIRKSEATERVVFALVAHRALEPGSKPGGTRWVTELVAIDGCPGFSDDATYRGMDFLLDALGEVAGEVFGSVATLLNQDLDLIFVDATSTCWETDGADDLADLAEPVVDDDGVSRLVDSGSRAFGHSNDHRSGLPQVVIAMAVTRDGVPVRCWTFAGNENDQAVIRRVTDDLAGWNLHRLVWGSSAVTSWPWAIHRSMLA